MKSVSKTIRMADSTYHKVCELADIYGRNESEVIVQAILFLNYYEKVAKTSWVGCDELLRSFMDGFTL